MVSTPKEPVTEVNKQAILVLGMHRSGTSALTELLSTMGAKAPLTPLKATHENVRGYWESKPLMVAHDAFLEKHGTSWSDSADFDLDQCIRDDILSFQEELKHCSGRVRRR